MKHTVKKTISLIMVLILLLTALASCGGAKEKDKETTPSINPGQSPETPENTEEVEEDTTLVFTLGNLEPLSKEKQLEVEEAWKKQKDSELLWCGTVLENGKTTYEDRYYGTFNNGVVIFHVAAWNIGVASTVNVAGQKIKFGTGFEIWICYDNGTFVEIEEAYESGLLSDKNVKDIAEYHEKFEQYRTGRG